MQVCRAVSPAVHVNPGDAVERTDRPFQPHGHHAQLRRKHVRQIAQVEVGAGLQDQHRRKSRWPVETSHAPTLAHPDVRLVRRAAGPAFSRIVAVTRWLDRNRIKELFDP